MLYNIPDDEKGEAVKDDIHGTSLENKGRFIKVEMISCDNLPVAFFPIVTHYALDGEIFIRDWDFNGI